MPRDLLDRDIVGNLDQKVLVRLRDFTFVRFLRREGPLHALPRVIGLARLVVVFDHVDGAFEPLGQEHGVLPAARFAEVGLGETHFRRFFLQVFLEPFGFLILLRDARLGQLICQVVKRLQELLPVRGSIVLLQSNRRPASCNVPLWARLKHLLFLVEGPRRSIPRR